MLWVLLVWYDLHDYWNWQRNKYKTFLVPNNKEKHVRLLPRYGRKCNLLTLTHSTCRCVCHWPWLRELQISTLMFSWLSDVLSGACCCARTSRRWVDNTICVRMLSVLVDTACRRILHFLHTAHLNVLLPCIMSLQFWHWRCCWVSARKSALFQSVYIMWQVNLRDIKSFWLPGKYTTLQFLKSD